MVAGLACLASPCAAQQVPTEPTSTHIFPAGGRRGTVVPVRVGGEFLPPYTRFRLFGEGVSAPPELVERATGNYEPSPRRKPGGSPITYPREWKSEIAIAADAPPGQKLWRTSSAGGGAGGRPFIVGDLPEFIETESNSVPDRAERVQLPVTINGQIAGERDLDYFRFEAAAGDVVSIDVVAARLGSPLDPVVEIQDLHGRRQTVEEIRVGSDPVIAFRVPASGEYRLLISNLNFHGGPHFVYRATISTAPYVLFAFPPGGRLGQSSEIELFSLDGNRALRSVKESIQFSAGASGEFLLNTATPTANVVTLDATDQPVALETEPNDTSATATSTTWPGVSYGRLSSGDDTDWFAVTAGKDQALTVECLPLPRGSGSLPVISICDAGGATLAQASTAALLPKPCRLEWRAPAEGRYFVRVQDVRREGTVAAYRLAIRSTRPDFSLAAAADIANVVQGARGELELRVDRQGGLAGPIDLAIEGLPEGVRFEPAQIPAGQEVVKLAFVAIDETRPGDAILKITASAKAGEETISRVASAAHLGRDVEGVSLGAPSIDHVQLTVRHKQVFRLFCNEAYQYANRGTIYPYQMEVERLNGFDGPIQLEMGDRQIMDLDGVEIVNSTFPAGTSQLMLPLYMPETMHINVQPHSNIYAQGFVVFQDKWGQRQSMLQVSEMRCMIRPLPTVARLRTREKSISIKAGESRTCVVQLDRTSNFGGAMRVELAAPPAHLHMDPVVIPADQSVAVVTIAADSELRQLPAQIKLRGAGGLPRDVTVVSEVILPVTAE
ncbi:MAG: PPC domain-containing protein [Planctomycetia bacterium]|nr:PPC domain-containing protein [Planctomycetia bacterium]